jgi:hypothetical protein
VGLLALYNGDRDLADTVLFTSKTHSDAVIFRLSSLKLASEKNAGLAELVMPTGINQVSKTYRETVLC